MANDRIDAISVGVGLDLRNIAGQAGKIQAELRKVTGDKAKPLEIPIHIFVPTAEIAKFKKQIAKDIQSGDPVNVPIKMGVVTSVDFRNFRRGIERQLRQFAGPTGQQGIHVPIQPADVEGFRKQIETKLGTVGVKLHFDGWEGEGPGGTGGGRGGGGGGTGGRGGGGTTGTGGGGGTTGTRANPAKGRAQEATQAAQARQEAATAERAARRAQERADKDARAARAQQREADRAAARAATPTPAPTRQAASPGVRRGTEVSSSDTYQAQEGPGRPGGRGVSRAGFRARHGSDRTSIDTLRFSNPQEELQGDERKEYVSQRRARSTPAMGWAEQPGERHTVTVRGRDGRPVQVSRVRPGASRSAQRRQEDLAQARHREAQEARISSEGDEQARWHFDEGLTTLHPALGRLQKMITAKRPNFTNDELRQQIEAAREVREDLFHGAPKGVRRGRTRVRATSKNFNMDTANPQLLQVDSMIDAASAFLERLVDPNAGIKKADNDLRGANGKVGRSGGFTAGNISSESTEPAAVAEIRRRRGIGGRGNGWQTLTEEFGRANVSQARAEINRNKNDPQVAFKGGPRLDVEMPTEGTFQGGAHMHAAGEAPSVQGGQGLVHGGAKAETASVIRQRSENMRTAISSSGPAPARPATPPPPIDIIPRTPGTADIYPAANLEAHREQMRQAEMERENIQARRTGRSFYDRQTSPWARFQGNWREDKQLSDFDRIARLRQHAFQRRELNRTPGESGVASDILRRYGLHGPGFAEGGVTHFADAGAKRQRNWAKFVGVEVPAKGPIPARILAQAFPELRGGMPRPGSHERKEYDRKYRVSVKNRIDYEQKPPEHRGGSKTTEYGRNRLIRLQENPWCASCGARRDLEADHILDLERGGTNALENLQTLCKSCNSRKAGGKSARPIDTPYREVAPYGPMRGDLIPQSKHQVGQRGRKPRRRAEGGSIRHFDDGGSFDWSDAKAKQEKLDRLFGDRPGMWYDKASGGWKYAHERETQEQYEARNQQEANNAHAGWEDRRQAGNNPGSGHGPFDDLHERMRQQRADSRQKTEGAFGSEGYQPGGDPGFYSRQGQQRAREEGRRHQAGIRFSNQAVSGHGPLIDKLIAMAGQTTQSPNEADVARRMLRKKGIPGYAEGGIYKASGLLGSARDKSVTMVGERGPELIVSDRNGESEVVPTHKVSSYLGGMSHRADGGGFQMRGARGPRAATEERLSSGVVGGGDITRVYVVNWPAVSGFGIAPDPATGEARSPGTRTRRPRRTRPEGEGTAGPFAADEDVPRTGTGSRGGGGINPAARAEARRETRGDPDLQGFESRIGAVRAGVQGSLQEAPVRALSVAFGQIAQQMIGGRSGILERARGATGLAGEAQQEFNILQGFQQEQAEVRSKQRLRARGISGETPEEQAKAEAAEAKRAPLLEQAIAVQAPEVEKATAAAEEAEKKVLTRGQQVRAQGVGLAGIIGGTQVFSAAIAGFSFVEEAATRALAPIVDETLSWAAALEKASGSLRDVIMQTRSVGARGEAIAGAGLSAGLGGEANQLLGGVADRARQQAASRVGLEARDLARAASGQLTRGNEALFTGTGGLFGTSLFAEQMGGQPGFLQTVGQRLAASDSPYAQSKLDPIGTGIGDAVASSPIFGSIAQMLGARTSSQRQAEYLGQESELRAENEAQIKSLNGAFERFGKSVGRATAEFELVPDATQEMKDAMIKSAAEISPDAADRARDLAVQGVAITGRGGVGLQGRQFEMAADQLAQGTLIPSPELMLQQSEPDRKLQSLVRTARGINTRQQDLPIQHALESLAAPAPGFGTTFSTEGLDKNPFGKETLARVSEYEKFATSAQKNVNAEIEEGKKQMSLMMAPLGRQANQEFTGLVEQIGSIGSEIQSLTEGISMRQVNLETKEFNNQARIMERSLGDARDLYAGIQGAVKGTVGGLQGQNMLLDRQNQLLGRRQTRLGFKSQDIGFKSSDLQRELQQLQFAQSQRQINFGVAMAGFVAPGSTPEERAARIEEAKLEAAEAQKQLDLQIKIANMAQQQLKIAKQQLAISKEQNQNSEKMQDNQFAINVEEAKRAITDLNTQLNLLYEGRAVAIDTKATEDKINRLNKIVGKITSQTQAWLQEAAELRDSIMVDTAKAVALTNQAWTDMQKLAGSAWTTFFSSYADAVDAMLHPGGGKSGGGAGGSQTPKLAAAGTIQTVNTATRFTAGEAGTEQVIVLRNPRQGMMSMPTGGGGGGGTVINMGGISISIGGVSGGDGDLDAMATRLASKVEEKISLRLSMQGGRPLYQ